MKYAALLLLLFSMAAAPLAPAAALSTPSAEACASACCATDPDCCSTACPCPPLSCQTSAPASVLMPAEASLAIFAPGSSLAAPLTDDTYSERTYRPPVPPPRA